MLFDLNSNNLDIFILSWSSHEDYIPLHFMGPASCSEKDFEKVCDILLDQAAFEAISNSKKEEYPSYIGWREIVEAFIPLLEIQGFKHFLPKEKKYYGHIIIDNDYDAAQLSSDARKAVLSYNQELHKKVDEEINHLMRGDTNKSV